MDKEKAHTMERIFHIRIFNEDDSENVVDLWKRCGLVVPWNDPHSDINRKLAMQAELFLIGTENNTIISTVMGGYDGHRGWLNYLAVDPGYRYRGYGASMVKEIENRIGKLGCPKINLQVRTTNAGVITFYRSLGYEVDDVVGLGKRIVIDQ